MRAVIDNRLSNAWKFPANTRDAVVEFYGETASNELVCLSGTGCRLWHGLRPDQLFRPLRWLHDPSEYPGNGRGLATVKRITTRLGGKVSAQDAPQ